VRLGVVYRRRLRIVIRMYYKEHEPALAADEGASGQRRKATTRALSRLKRRRLAAVEA